MKDYSSIALSSEVKLLRNLNGFKFPSIYEGMEGEKVLNKIADALILCGEDFKIYKMSNLSEMDINLMLEKKLITNRLIDNKFCSAVLLDNSEKVWIMINETDHISLNCKFDGLNLINCYDKINEIDNFVLSKLDIAYDDSIGFLTSNILNVGTGLKATINLFLPALSLLGRVKELSINLENQGFELKQIADDGFDEVAYQYSLSNIQTIGKKETDYVVKVSEFAIKICEMEIAARNELMNLTNIDDTKDKVFRAWGIITNCFKISSKEASKLLSDLKLGMFLDIIRFKDAMFFKTIFTDILPYSLTKISGSKITTAELDKYRAKFLTDILKAKRIK